MGVALSGEVCNLKDLIKVIIFIFIIALDITVNITYFFVYEAERKGNNSLEWLRVYLFITQILPLGIISTFSIIQVFMHNS